MVQQTNSLTPPFHPSIGGVEAPVSYDGLAPGAVGFYQFNVTVPNVAPGSAVPESAGEYARGRPGPERVRSPEEATRGGLDNRAPIRYSTDMPRFGIYSAIRRKGEQCPPKSY